MGLATQMMKEVAALIRLGFPESTATKIASGELPMDKPSRMQRAAEQKKKSLPAGLEPATIGSAIRRANQLHHRPIGYRL